MLLAAPTPSHPVVLCPHALLTPPAPRFVNPPPGLFQLRRCLGHHTHLSMAQCEFFFLSFCFCSLLLHCPFVPHPFPHAVSILLCRVPSLMPHPLSHATSILSCRIFTPTCAASTPLPLAYPGCIDIPTSVHCVRCLSTPLHCTLCSVCVVPPPPPTPLPHLICTSVRVPVRLCTCYFTCIRIRL